MTSTIKRIHNLPPHLSYVPTLLEITQKWKSCHCVSSVSGSENN